MADGRALVGGALQLGDERGDLALDIELHRSRHQAEQRFRHRHQDVRRLGAHAVEIALEHQFAAMQGDDAVRVRIGEKPIVEQFHRRCGQRRDASRVVGNLGARDQLADVVECPTVVRRRPPVRERNLRFARRRECVHQASH